jgi:hypothetical protein
MRPLGGAFPSLPSAVAGTIEGTAAKRAARFRNSRRVRVESFFDMAIS